MKGGYRPGAGRKKGARDTKPRKGSQASIEAEQIRGLLSVAQKAKAKILQDFVRRVADPKQLNPLSVTEKRLMMQLHAEIEGVQVDDNAGKEGAELKERIDPLDYGLDIISDTSESPERRDRMAIALLPYLYSRKGEGGGKKEEKADRAKVAAGGKFAPGKPPQLKVVNK